MIDIAVIVLTLVTVSLQYTSLSFKMGLSKIKRSFWAFISSGKLTTVLPCPCLKTTQRTDCAATREKIEFLAEPERGRVRHDL